MIKTMPNKHPGTLTDFISFEETQAGIWIKALAGGSVGRQMQVQLKAPNVSKSTFLLAWL